MTSVPLALRLGIGLLAIGAGPLLLFILADQMGLIQDPNPNPIGLGLLFLASVVPASGLILVGVLQMVWRWLQRRP